MEKTYYRCSAVERQERPEQSLNAPALEDEDRAPGLFLCAKRSQGLPDTPNGGEKLIVIHLCQ